MMRIDVRLLLFECIPGNERQLIQKDLELTRHDSENCLRPSFLWLLIDFHTLLVFRIQPALFDSSLYSPNIFLHIFPVQLCCLCVGGTVRIRIVQQTLDGRKDRGYVVCWRPPILQDIKTQLSIGIYIWVEHSREELHSGRLVGIRFVEIQSQLECAILEGCFRCPKDVLLTTGHSMLRNTRTWAENDSIPNHYVIRAWTP